MPYTAEDLFLRFFWPLYPPGAREDLARARAVDANPAQNPSVLAHLEGAAEVFVARAPALFGDEAALDYTDASVHRLSRAITRARRDAWAADGPPGTPESALFNVVVHGAAYVGECARRGRDAAWAVRRPLWESLVVLRSRAGEGELPVFHWWLKSLSDDALEGRGSLADRYRTHVEVPTADVDAWPVWLEPSRRLPRLAKVRYDVLYKHLKAHLPELRDLGRDFPSPERFAEMGFRWLDFAVLGAGRVVLAYGAGTGGVHLFWLDANGFQKGAFFPADSFPEPRVVAAGDKLRVLTQIDGAPVTHELLWWGP